MYNKQKEGERMTNETLNVIKSRRSTRAYKTDPVPEKLLDAVLEAGTFAPSGMNKQSPTIVAVSSDKYRRDGLRNPIFADFWYKILSLNFVQNDGGKTKKKNVKRERLLSHALTFFLVCGDYSSGRAKTSSLTS